MMLKHFFTTTLFFIFCLNISAQNAVSLATISEGSPNSLSGLGYSFTGQLMDDGLLYFRGSTDGFYESVWTTDGTVAGTQKLVDETDGNWNSLLFVDAGVLALFNNDGWKILKPGTTQFVTLQDFPTEYIKHIQKSANDQYYFTVERDDDQVLYATDFNQTTTEIGILHPDHSMLTLSAGTEAVTMFNTNSFVTDYPSMYRFDTDEIVSISDYLSQWFTVSSVDYAYLYGKYMIFSFNSSQRYIMDMQNETYEQFSYIDQPYAYHEFGDEVYVISKSKVSKFNKNTLSNTDVFQYAYAFGTSLTIEDKLYVHGSEEGGGSVGVIEIDILTDNTRLLPGSLIGDFFYGSRLESFDNELYYISRSDYSLLNKYDFDNDTPIVIDTLSTVTGATVDHALETVGDYLVISKRPMSLGHELYVMNFDINTSIINNIPVTDLMAVPTISSSTIHLYVEGSKFIHNSPINLMDMQGNRISNISIKNGVIDIQKLAVGMYIGFIEVEDKIYRFKVMKQ